jgi:hypothetical protein
VLWECGMWKTTSRGLCALVSVLFITASTCAMGYAEPLPVWTSLTTTH